MEELTLDIFVVPTIALTLVILGYLYFTRRVKDVGEYKSFVMAVAVTSFALNFVWELAQGPLYEGFEYDLKHISFCALASIADMLMVFILLFAFGLIYKDVYWMQNWGLKRILLLVLVGFFGAILAEVWHTARGDWAYADAMPRLPMVEVGLSPVLQFTILPWLIFLICKKFIKEKVW
ncbi:hypothetical protein [Euzebyella saccharophila]|uniref:Lycopene cyclase domain-containing protein n=1 Tax=Euzebyella saccharophila TaxID=679664 RepID=A0ABV8JSL7_9FLAO|nr:hypothetical protein [Euzebyella saccharophila]